MDRVKVAAADGRTKATSALKNSLAIGAKIDTLGPGDILTVAVQGSLAAGVLAGVGGTLTVSRPTADEYIVNTGLSGSLGVRLFGGAIAGAGASADFAFSSAKEAKAAIASLLPGGSPPGKALSGHLRAVNLSASLIAALDAHFGLGPATFGAQAALLPSIQYSVVFRDGKASLQRTLAVTASVNGRITADVVPGAVGMTERLQAGATAAANIVSTLPLPDDISAGGALKAVAFVADLSGLSGRALGTSNMVALTWTHSTQALNNDRGTTYSMLAGNVSMGDAARAAGRALKGDVAGARESLGGVLTSNYTFVDRGFDRGVDVAFAGAGFSVRFQNEVRDVEVLA